MDPAVATRTRTIFRQLVAEGMAPNDAAAEAVKRAVAQVGHAMLKKALDESKHQPAPAAARQPGGPRTPRTAPAGRQPYDATPSTARSSASSAASEPRSNSPVQRERSPPAEPGLGAACRERPPQHDAPALP